MNLKRFMQQSGFKVLALAKLKPCEYSVTLYLLNVAASGLDQFVTTESELASLIGYDEKELRESLADLSARQIVKIYYSDTGMNIERQSIRIGIQFDMKRWSLGDENTTTHQDAIIFPFRRQGKANLMVLEGDKAKSEQSVQRTGLEQEARKILEAFVAQRSLDDDELIQAEDVARIMVETHPSDQILLMIKHFGFRIPTLSLLASSWQHYQELFEAETQKVDLLEARQKHVEQDEKLRSSARACLDKSLDLGLSEEEQNVLTILAKHNHPRRQLFWAYQLRSRYPKLQDFFQDNANLMLAVTSSGTVVKKGSNQDPV